MTNVRIPFIGAPMYCPDCRRLLVTFQPGGRMDVAGKTELRGSAEGSYDDDGHEMMPDALIVTHAICLRRVCKIKRWIRDNKEERKR